MPTANKVGMEAESYPHLDDVLARLSDAKRRSADAAAATILALYDVAEALLAIAARIERDQAALVAEVDGVSAAMSNEQVRPT